MNVQERDLRILEHILTCCDQIDMAVERFGHSFDLFDSDPVYRNAVALCIVQIGELVGHLSDEFKAASGQIPWRQIKLMRISWPIGMERRTTRSHGKWSKKIF